MNQSPNPLRLIWGLFFILGGALLFALQLGWKVDFSLYWPVFLLAPGVVLWINYMFAQGKVAKILLLLFGAILIGLGAIFMVATANEFEHFENMAFLFPAIVASGFMLVWLLENQHKVYLALALLNTIAAAIVFGVMNFFDLILPALFLATGFMLIVRGRPKSSKTPDWQTPISSDQLPTDVSVEQDIRQASVENSQSTLPAEAPASQPATTLPTGVGHIHVPTKPKRLVKSADARRRRSSKQP